MLSMAHVTRYVPGNSMSNGEGTRDAPIFRGSANALGDFYIDAVRDDVEYYRDLYNVGRVEALRFCRISQRWRTGRVNCCAESRINTHAQLQRDALSDRRDLGLHPLVIDPSLLIVMSPSKKCICGWAGRSLMRLDCMSMPYTCQSVVSKKRLDRW